MSTKRVLHLVAAFLPAACSLTAQSPDSAPVVPVVAPAASQQFDIIPEVASPFVRITAAQKFRLAIRESKDPLNYFYAGLSAGTGQWGNTNPSFGQGMEGFGHRFGASLLNQSISNYLSIAVLPSLLHQDPRYYRKGSGGYVGRAVWAASRVAVARNDKGNWGFNTSEFLGTGMAASIGNAYFPDRVGFQWTMQRMFAQIGTDVLANMLKEFLPDVKKKMERHPKATAPLK